MVEYKDMCSSSVRTPKLQFAAEQPLNWRMLDPTKKRYPMSKGKVEALARQQEGKIAFRIKPLTRQRCLEDSNKLCVYQNPETPTETEHSGSLICVYIYIYEFFFDIIFIMDWHRILDIVSCAISRTLLFIHSFRSRFLSLNTLK